jgi:L-threonylcarbamoyladenylate synthase
MVYWGQVLMLMEKQIELAIVILRRGGVVVFPTDTVYGIGANPFIEQAVVEIYRTKQRPHHLALPLLLGDSSELELVSDAIPDAAWRLAQRFLPGGLTLILNKASGVPSTVAPRNTVAVRIPNHPIPIALIRGLGTPLIGTSANLWGEPSPVTFEEAQRQLGGRVELIIDGGRCPLGIESTVVDVTDRVPRIVRQGAVSRREIEEVCGRCL